LAEPEILFLDEPTSGTDPLARREFWQRITVLAEGGVTVIVTTHFMEEAEYCDRVAILDAGRILAQGTPAEIRSRGMAEAGREPNMEDAFIAIVQEARADRTKDTRRSQPPDGQSDPRRVLTIDHIDRPPIGIRTPKT
jgi:ABC-2 type transport system ATP-binding protein